MIHIIKKESTPITHQLVDFTFLFIRFHENVVKWQTCVTRYLGNLEAKFVRKLRMDLVWETPHIFNDQNQVGLLF